jgi:enoyl-CoA hydratase/carnithine racemase
MNAPALRAEWRGDDANQGVMCVTLHATGALNLVDRDWLVRARDDFSGVLRTPGLRCVLLAGATPRAFIGGANLHALAALDTDTAQAFIGAVHELCAVVRGAEVPVIAVMQGYCLGAGLEIACACDWRIGDTSVRCGMPEVRVGVPSVVEAALLPGIVGWGKARELMLRGHVIEAEEAFKIGLLQALVASEQLETSALRMAADVVAGAPAAIANQKRLFLAWEEQAMSGAIAQGIETFVASYAGEEPQRYVARFFAERKPPAS